MDAQTFLENFANIADAPGGVHRLRDLVVAMAVDGRLLDQRLSEDESQVHRLGDVVDLVSGQHLKPEEYNRHGDGIPYLTGPADFTENGPAASRWTHERRAIATAGDILLTVKGAGIGKLCVLDVREAAISRQLIAVRPTQISGGYLKLVLTSLRHQLRSAQVGIAIPGISRSDILDCTVLLPPLAEQEQVVAKVADLISLCNRLESRQERRHRASTQLRCSALQALTAGETYMDLRRAWERISTHWDALTDHPDHIDALKPAVLQLAIEGRLVGRSTEDGTARDVMGEIEHQRTALVSDGRIAGTKTRNPVEPTAVPFVLPDHWLWVHVEDVVIHIVDCLHRTPTYASKGFPAIRTCDVEPGRVLLEQALLVDELTFREQTRRLPPKAGDILYSREGGRYGIAAVVPSGVELCLSQRMMQFRCADAVVPEYLSWFLNSPLGFGQASEDVGGSASPHVNIRSIRRFMLPLPPTGEQIRIVLTLKHLLAQIDDLVAVTRRRAQVGARLADAVASKGVAQSG